MNAREICRQFANKHKVIFEDKGECGFGRPCVGFIRGSGYIAHNPCTSGDYSPIAEFADDRLYPPVPVPDAYHKHDCLAVLARGDEPNYEKAIEQLAAWVKHLESLGEVEVGQYETGATGLQAALSGMLGWAVRIKQ
jgi:hypothetical protein